MAPCSGTGQRAQLDLDGTSATAVPGQPVSGAQFSGATVDLHNATAADPTAGITVTINANGTATVTGAVNAADNGTSSVPVTEVIGNVLNRFRLNAPDTDSTWHLTGLNEGYLTPDGLNPIQFTSVDYLNGGSAKDTFIIDQLAGVTGGIDGGAGTLALQLFDFLYVSVDGGLDFTTTTGDLVRNDGHTYGNVGYSVLSAEGVNAFVGNGLPSDPLAAGLSLTDVDFSLVLFTDGPKDGGVVYTALKTSGGTASVVGVPDLDSGCMVLRCPAEPDQRRCSSRVWFSISTMARPIRWPAFRSHPRLAPRLTSKARAASCWMLWARHRLTSLVP